MNPDLVAYYLEKKNSFLTTQAIFAVGLIIISLYFLQNEFKQFMRRGASYFTDFWNLIDILPTFLVCVMCAIEVAIEEHDKFYSDPWVVCVLSFISLLMWMKMGYFLRLFQRFAYLINMILRVIKDMVSFLVVMLIGVAAFTESFLIISDSITMDASKPGEVGFAGTPLNAIFYVYRMAVGDFDFGDFEGEQLTMHYLWFLFFICTMFNMIIMLNLLIAIISESFAAVNAT